MAAQVSPLLEKLDPRSMMEDDGLQKANIAIKLLAQKVTTDATTASAIAEANGVLILLQTALLHPVPELREGAITVIAGCVRCADNASFMEMALEKNLPAALVRLCSEQDRRAKKSHGDEGELGEGSQEKAHDPDLPVRRVAVDVLADVLFRIDVKTTLRVLGSTEWHGVVGTCFALIGNTDARIRERGATLLARLMGVPHDKGGDAHAASAEPPLVAFTQEQREQLISFSREYASAEAEKAAAVLTLALSDDDEHVRAVACEVMRALRPSTALREQLRANNAVVAAAALGSQASEVVDWLGGVEAAMRAEV